jgi:hypothetical protein
MVIVSDVVTSVEIDCDRGLRQFSAFAASISGLQGFEFFDI